jgi:hypothetical protein
MGQGRLRGSNSGLLPVQRRLMQALPEGRPSLFAMFWRLRSVGISQPPDMLGHNGFYFLSGYAFAETTRDRPSDVANDVI